MRVGAEGTLSGSWRVLDSARQPWQTAAVAARKPRLTPEKALAPETLEKNATSYLNRFDSSAANLRKVLQRGIRRHGRQVDPDLVQRAEAYVEELIARYLASGLLNDQRYAATIAWSLRERGSSQRAIAHKLSARGVDAAAIQDAISEADRDRGVDGDLDAARRFARKRRLGPHRAADERTARRDRDLGALARAGFSLEVACRVLEEDLD